VKYVVQEGSHSVADAVALCRPEVIASYPITPQTHIVERLAALIADGVLDAEYINVESEHSALSLIAGSTACGVRSYTATSSQGLALMHEVLHATAGMRLPVTMTVANRALSAPLNIWNDHSDSMSQRDTSWLQFYAETVQEAVDLQIQAFKIAESIQLPAMVCMDGYVLTHTYEPVMIPDQSDVDSFLPPFELDYKLDTTNPVTLGAYATPDDYMEFKYEQQLAMDEAKDEIKKVNKEFDSIFGREYGNGMIELFGMDEAEVALIAMGSVCGTIKDAIEGTNCGLIRIRSYRPFPAKELKKAVKGLRAVGVIDRAFSYGFGGPLFSEVKSTVDGVAIKNFIAGLGGRDIRIQDIRDMTAKLESKEEIVWINLKDYGRG
jgi:pyruvate ferredoxin oxidoreductase alpha subunit